MKKTLQLLLFLTLATTTIFANINVVVSILPQKTFVQEIGGEKVDISLMVQPGDSPHTYEPKPSQMKEIAKAALYLAMDVEFENVWLPKFKNLNPKMNVVDLAENITKIAMMAHHHHDEHEEKEHHEAHEADDHHEHEDGLDPHVWTSPENVRIIAKNIHKALSEYDPDNQAYYTQNLTKFLEKIDATDRRIKEILTSIKPHSTFMVFHPAWGYFAKAYDLVQLPVEIEGKEPKPKELVKLIETAKEHKVKAIFTQPEFSDATAKVISEELGIKVIKVSPLAADWSQNLIDLAKAIAGKE
ncbi:MAG: zinc ABC transporter substrate-binding protein [Campylobacterales bacterium]|nr:zinc ABC transporter substrate-binding protein [Campylobacterales bacterium]